MDDIMSALEKKKDCKGNKDSKDNKDGKDGEDGKSDKDVDEGGGRSGHNRRWKHPEMGWLIQCKAYVTTTLRAQQGETRHDIPGQTGDAGG